MSTVNCFSIIKQKLVCRMRGSLQRDTDERKSLERFPERGFWFKYDTLMGKHGFGLFIDQYACVYKIEGDTVYIYHLADARKNYIYHIFGMEEPDSTT